MKKDVYWFKHDSGVGREIEMRKMAHTYSHWGKGIYWDVIEILREQSNYGFKSDENSLQFLAEIIGCKDTIRFTNWFNECVRDGLFFIHENMFYSPRLTEDMKFWDAKKIAGSQGGIAKSLANAKQTSSKTLANGVANVKQNSGNNRTEHNITKQNKTIDLSFIPSEFMTAVNKWLIYKKERKESYAGQVSVKSFFNKLNELSKNTPELADKIIEQSMANNWAGIFPLRDTPQEVKPKGGMVY